MCCLNIRRFFGLFLQKVFFGLLLNEAEIILAYSAKRANPIIRDVFECCTWSDALRVIPNIRFDWVVEEGFAEIPSWHPAVEKVIPVAIRRSASQRQTCCTASE